jgi:nondiscriminating glutamyl-tRNA synthetase
MSASVTTRFAPSPTGRLHLGNARTALFNWLYARANGGRFVLRIEDTDAARSTAAHEADLCRDLAWLGLAWDAGPDREDGRGPYRQSERGARYDAGFDALVRTDRAYPCWCTAEELELSRRAQAAAGRPPRYAGTCAQLDAAGRARRAASGVAPTLRFRVPEGGDVAFDDLVRGPQRFANAELGDFVIRRADGTAAFLFSNVVDDAAMGVTHALRGEDHVSNTPRQLLVAAALGIAPPRYGHLPLLVGADGAPLSKRHGSDSVDDVRAAGYLPQAVLNLLCRLGHRYVADGWLEPAAMIAGFDLAALGHAPSQFDPAQLRHWQKEAVARADVATLAAWAPYAVPAGARDVFVAAVRPNLLLPADAAEWAHVVYGDLPCAEGAARDAIVQAGAAYFDAALALVDAVPADGRVEYAPLVAGLRERTGRKGRDLFQPLRAALTHRLDGPELAALLGLLPAARVRERLARARTQAVV